ncbi:MAG: nucleotidyltransferase domain-containing protein [Anaerolineae bacterium]|nr:nucleotidyltransferase domain-containing protein [Anaerolineae bacterium]
MPTKTTLDRTTIIARCADLFAAEPHVTVAYLFGSYARDQAGALSDVDIAVLLDDSISEADYFEERLRLMGEVTDALKFDDVDVVVLNQAPLALAYRVLRDGVVLACRDRDRRVQYTARIVSRYLDFKPVIERFERAIIERARRGELTRGYDPYHDALERYFRLRESLETVPEADV